MYDTRNTSYQKHKPNLHPLTSEIAQCGTTASNYVGH
jgi:hypothetical protein